MCGGGGDNLVAIWSLQTMIFISESFPVSLWKQTWQRGQWKRFLSFPWWHCIGPCKLAVVTDWRSISWFNGPNVAFPAKIGFDWDLEGSETSKDVVWVAHDFVVILRFCFYVIFLLLLYCILKRYVRQEAPNNLKRRSREVVSFLVRMNFPKRILYCCMRNSCM